MARGGFISASVALKRVFKCVGSRTEAQRMIADALMVGEISARGRPQIEEPDLDLCDDQSSARGSSETPGSDLSLSAEKTTLNASSESQESDITPCNDELVDQDYRPTDIYSKEILLGEIVYIPEHTWTGLSDKDFSRWDWDDGIFFNDNLDECENFYEDISFKEKDINVLIKRWESIKMPPETKPKRERMRPSSWDDWVAAVTILAIENQIHGNMRQTDLLDRIDKRLESWKLSPKERSTVAPAARAILERLRTNPPVPPLDATHPGGKKP